MDDVWAASDVQLYLDLSAWPQRGLEHLGRLSREARGHRVSHLLLHAVFSSKPARVPRPGWTVRR